VKRALNESKDGLNQWLPQIPMALPRTRQRVARLLESQTKIPEIEAKMHLG
jgi:hypothetical protein